MQDPRDNEDERDGDDVAEIEERDDEPLEDNSATTQPQPGNDRGDDIDRLTAFVNFMVTNVVDDPTTVQVVPERLGANVHIRVIVPEEEMGRVIGRQGRIARSMRTLLTIAASRKGMRASLDIDS